METVELKDGGVLIHDDTTLPLDIADRYFVELHHNGAWEHSRFRRG